MVLDVDANTYAALQAARTKGIVPRDLVWFKAKNRDTGELETVGIWSGAVAETLPVRRPDDGTTSNRVYQPGAGLMEIPAIPMTMSFEERRLRLTFSNLSPAIINAVRVYKAKGQPIEIHRLLLDPETMRAVAPAHCRFDGLVRGVKMKRAKVGNDGKVIVEVVGHSATLKSNPAKLSEELFARRGNPGAGKYLNSTPKVVWMGESKVHEHRARRRRRWIR